MKRATTTLLIALAASAAACNRGGEPASGEPISETDANRIADATVAAWTSGNATRIKGLYAPNVQQYDDPAPLLAANRAEFDRRQDSFAAAGFYRASQRERRIQILAPDTFVINGAWDLTSTAIPANNASFRCSIVYKRNEEGNWRIVNEHCAPVPGQPAAAAPAAT